MIERFGHAKIRLLECPACGEDLRGTTPSDHIETHSPADFGLGDESQNEVPTDQESVPTKVGEAP